MSTVHGGGDDLDDDFVPDDLVAMSEDEDDLNSPDGEDINALLSAEEGESSQPDAAKKEAAAAKKRKRREKEKERKAKVRALAPLMIPWRPIHSHSYTNTQKQRVAESMEVVAPASVAMQSPLALSEDRKSTRLNSSHSGESRMPSSA